MSMVGKTGSVGPVHFTVAEDLRIIRMKVRVNGAPDLERSHGWRIRPVEVWVRVEAGVPEVSVSGIVVGQGPPFTAGEMYMGAEQVKEAPRWVQELIIGLGVAV